MIPRTAARDAARVYDAKGWGVIRVPDRSKNPGRAGWQDERLTGDALAASFPDGPSNVGLLLGAPSGGLLDVDLDGPEARSLADAVLPESGAVFGRPSSPRSHRLYAVADVPATKKYADPTVTRADDGRAMLLELRSNGAHTLVPPSVHPSGEAIAWDEDGDPATVEAAVLLVACGRLAAMALLARHWPGRGSRHDAALALAGGLLRAGWDVEDAAELIRLVATAAGDEEADARARDARATAAAIAAGKEATGWPRLAGHVDERVVKKVREWLGITGSPGAGTSGGGDREGSQASTLVALALARGFDLFHDAAGDPYCAVPVEDATGGHVETWPLRTKHVKSMLSRLHYQERGKVPSAQALQDALQVLEGEARFAGGERPVAVRLADEGGTLYLDLGDPAWRVVVVSPGRWEIVAASEVPVRFRRPRGLLALPEPVRGGSLAPLLDLLNVSAEEDALLLVGWLLGCLYPRGPRAVLQLLGEQGSAKSTVARLLRSLVDPNLVPLRTQPRDEGDLLIAATNGSLVALDNLSELPRWLSDALCRLATGGGLSKRELYTDGEEVLLDAKRPVLLTAIGEVATAGDLLDRCVTVVLPPIPPERRRTEDEVERLAAAARPGALGALLDAAAAGLAALPTTVLARRPRLADFATWVEAAAPSLGWDEGAFLDALEANRKKADAVAIEALPVGPVLEAFARGLDEEWVGTATELLAELTSRVSEEVRKERDWPKRANTLSNQLRRLAPNLRRVGVWVGNERRSGDGRRLITLGTREGYQNGGDQNGGAEDRHHRHDRHGEDEPGTDGAATRDDPRPSPSSRHRHGSSHPGAQRETTPGTNPFEEDADEPSCDDRDDGDDESPHCSKQDLAGVLVHAGDGDGEEVWEWTR